MSVAVTTLVVVARKGVTAIDLGVIEVGGALELHFVARPMMPAVQGAPAGQAEFSLAKRGQACEAGVEAPRATWMAVAGVEVQLAAVTVFVEAEARVQPPVAARAEGGLVAARVEAGKVGAVMDQG